MFPSVCSCARTKTKIRSVEKHCRHRPSLIFFFFFCHRISSETNETCLLGSPQCLVEFWSKDEFDISVPGFSVCNHWSPCCRRRGGYAPFEPSNLYFGGSRVKEMAFFTLVTDSFDFHFRTNLSHVWRIRTYLSHIWIIRTNSLQVWQIRANSSHV